MLIPASSEYWVSQKKLLCDIFGIIQTTWNGNFFLIEITDKELSLNKFWKHLVKIRHSNSHISCINEKKKNIFCKNAYPNVVAHARSFQLLATSSSFFCAFFSLLWSNFFWDTQYILSWMIFFEKRLAVSCSMNSLWTVFDTCTMVQNRKKTHLIIHCPTSSGAKWASERMDKWMAYYLRLGFRLVWPTVTWTFFTSHSISASLDGVWVIK